MKKVDDTTIATVIEQLRNSTHSSGSAPISELYEALLVIETRDDNEQLSAADAKNYRNKLGSYYTPTRLAQVITQRTIDLFFQKNLGISELSASDIQTLSQEHKTKLLGSLDSITFADFSCGTGNFLIAVVRYFQQLFQRLELKPSDVKKLTEKIAHNIHAYDVDCIALEIAKYSLAIEIDSPHLCQEIERNFHHGNFLLHTNKEQAGARRRQSFASGFIYHQDLAISEDELGTFDVILGNPPWEKIRFEEKQFYLMHRAEIGRITKKNERRSAILQNDELGTPLAHYVREYRDEIHTAKQKIKADPFFSLASSGELNTYSLFAEAAIRLRSPKGVVGLLLKSSIVTTRANQEIFTSLVRQNLIEGIFDFINRKKIFSIDSRERFCVLLLGPPNDGYFRVAMNLTSIDSLTDPDDQLRISKTELGIISPDTGMLPNTTSGEEFNLLLRSSGDLPSFKDVFGGVKFGRIVHLTNHSDFISRSSAPNGLAIYEGKFFHQFDGKYADFSGVNDTARYASKARASPIPIDRKHNRSYVPQSRFFISSEKWEELSKNYQADFMLAWRSLTSATNERTCVATLLPFVPATQSVQFLISDDSELLFLAGLFNSLVFDFLVKKRLSGIDLTRSVIDQVPVPTIEKRQDQFEYAGVVESHESHIHRLVFSLLRDDGRLDQFFERMNFTEADAIAKDRESILRDLDRAFARMYELSADEFTIILRSFPKLKPGRPLKINSEQISEHELDKPICTATTAASSVCPIR